MAESTPLIDGASSDSGSVPDSIRDDVQQLVTALARRSTTSKLVVAQKVVTSGLDIMLSFLGPEVVAHWLRRCADSVEAPQVKP
jgi:hypothetical protein